MLPVRVKLLDGAVGGFNVPPAGLGSRDVDLDLTPDLTLLVFKRDVLLLSAAAPEFRRDSRLVDDPERIGILVGDVTGVRTLSLSSFPPMLSSCPDCSESLLGVPMIGDNVVGFEMRLFDRDAPEATMPRSIIDDVTPGAPTFDNLRFGEMELRRRVGGTISRLEVMLFRRGILDGEL